jgi:Rhodopirellula transposase DDE domain
MLEGGSLAELTGKFRALSPWLDEPTRRLMAASKAKTLAYRSVSLVRRGMRAVAEGDRRFCLRKQELQRLADETLTLWVGYFPPGTSKGNKLEHRLFSFISSNWRGEPLHDYQAVIHLIAKTTSAKGPTVTCRLDRRKYPRSQSYSKKRANGSIFIPIDFMAYGTMSSDLIRPGATGKRNELMLFILFTVPYFLETARSLQIKL